MMRTRPGDARRTPVLLASGFALALCVAACGDDDDAATEPTPATGAVAATEPSPVTASSAATTDEQATSDVVPDPDHPYCEVERQVDSIFEEELSGVDATAGEEEQLAAIQTTSQRIIDEGLIEQGEELVPDELRADFEVLVAAVRDAADGDFDAIMSPESDAAGTRVDMFCGLTEE